MRFERKRDPNISVSKRGRMTLIRPLAELEQRVKKLLQELEQEEENDDGEIPPPPESA